MLSIIKKITNLKAITNLKVDINLIILNSKGKMNFICGTNQKLNLK